MRTAVAIGSRFWFVVQGAGFRFVVPGSGSKFLVRVARHSHKYSTMISHYLRRIDHEDRPGTKNAEPEPGTTNRNPAP